MATDFNGQTQPPNDIPVKRYATLTDLPNELLRAITKLLPDEDLLVFCRLNKLCNLHGLLEYFPGRKRSPKDPLPADVGVMPLCRKRTPEHVQKELLRGLGVMLTPRTCQGFTCALEYAETARLLRGWVRRFPTVRRVHIQVGALSQRNEPTFLSEVAGLIHVLAGKGCERLIIEDDICWRDAELYGLKPITSEDWKRCEEYVVTPGKAPSSLCGSSKADSGMKDDLPSYLHKASPLPTLRQMKLTQSTLFVYPFAVWAVNSLNTSPLEVLVLDFLSKHGWSDAREDKLWWTPFLHLSLPSLRKFELRTHLLPPAALRAFLSRHPTIKELKVWGAGTQATLGDSAPGALETVSGAPLSVAGVLSTTCALPNLKRVSLEQIDDMDYLDRALTALADNTFPSGITLAFDFVSVAKCVQWIGRRNHRESRSFKHAERRAGSVARVEVIIPLGAVIREEDGMQMNLLGNIPAWLGLFPALDEVSLGLYTSGDLKLSKEDEERAVRGIFEYAPGLKRAKVSNDGETRSIAEWKEMYS